MVKTKGLEYHIYKLLPPSNWHGKGDETVTLRDYYDNIKAPFKLDIDKYKAKGLTIINDDDTKFDAGQIFFAFKGPKEYADKLKKEFYNEIESYLKNYSKNDEYKLRDEFIRVSDHI
jgi:hypothetical protein